MEIKFFGKKVHIPLNGLHVSRRLEFNLLRRYLNPQGDERVLDVACGDGFWTARLIPKVAGVVGFDLNAHRLRQALELAPDMQGAIRCDAHHLPFKNNAFDCTLGICVLEHFEDDVGALRELHRVTKPGGKIAISVDSFSYPGLSEAEKKKHAQKFSVVHHYLIEDLTLKMQAAGFQVTQWSYLLRSPISAAFYQLTLKAPKLSYFLYPITYPLSLCSERLSKNQSNGYKLAVAARAV